VPDGSRARDFRCPSLPFPRRRSGASDGGDACADAVRLVTSGEASDTHEGGALAHIVRCPDGPVVIAVRWRGAVDRPEVLAQLRAWNYQIHDQPIAEAAITVARDPSRPTNLRLLALETLVSYLGARLTGQAEFTHALVPSRPPQIYRIVCTR